MATDLSAGDLIGSVATEGAAEDAIEENSLPPMPELDAALEAWLRSTDSSNVDVTELISSAVALGTPLSDSAPAQPEVFPYLSDTAIPVASPVESFANSQIAVSDGTTSDLAMTAANNAELDEALKLLAELSSENDPLAVAAAPVER